MSSITSSMPRVLGVLLFDNATKSLAYDLILQLAKTTGLTKLYTDPSDFLTVPYHTYIEFLSILRCMISNELSQHKYQGPKKVYKETPSGRIKGVVEDVLVGLSREGVVKSRRALIEVIQSSFRR